MENLGKYNNREVFYLSSKPAKDWLGELPTGNWLVLPIGDCVDSKAYIELADQCLANNVLYVCAVGECCEIIHDIFDETVVANKIIAGENTNSQINFENSPMTTWHNDFDEGVWFAMTTAFNDTVEINKIICIDFTENKYKQRVIELIGRIQEGWIPQDNR